MSAVPLRTLNGRVSVERVVSVLGATGSIGDSTMDLIRRGGDRYRVEALTAHRNVEALAKRALSGAELRQSRRADKGNHHCVRRAFPHLVKGGHRNCYA